MYDETRALVEKLRALRPELTDAQLADWLMGMVIYLKKWEVKHSEQADERDGESTGES